MFFDVYVDGGISITLGEKIEGRVGLFGLTQLGYNGGLSRLWYTECSRVCFACHAWIDTTVDPVHSKIEAISILGTYTLK